MRGRVQSAGLLTLCGAAAAALSQPALGRAWKESAPWALASSPPLRSLSLGDVICTALVTDLSRAAIAVHAPAAVVSALLQAKAAALQPLSVVAEDRVVLHVAPLSVGEQDDVPDVVRDSVAQLGCCPAAVVVSPDIFVSPTVLERHGAALVAGMRLWQEYMSSLAVVGPPPLPNDDTVISRDDCRRLDRLMLILGQLCELASSLKFDIALCLVADEQTRREAFWRFGSTHPLAAIVSTIRDFVGADGAGGERRGVDAGATATELARKSAGFNRAVAVAHIATCFARAFADPDAGKGVFPSLLLSADSTRDMHAVELLADQTLVKLSLRLAPAAAHTTLARTYTEHSSLAPAVLAVPGLQSIPAAQPVHPPVLEYTRGIGDLQTGRLRAAIGKAAGRAGGGAPPPHALVRREFGGARSRLHAEAARTPLARAALRAESRALWTRARVLVEDLVGAR